MPRQWRYFFDILWRIALDDVPLPGLIAMGDLILYTMMLAGPFPAIFDDFCRSAWKIAGPPDRKSW